MYMLIYILITENNVSIKLNNYNTVAGHMADFYVPKYFDFSLFKTDFQFN